MPFLGKVPSQIVDSDVDIDGGTIDGATIGSITAGAGTFTNLSATGTITFPDDGISGDDINGGTISNVAISGTTASFSGDLAVDTDTLFVDSSSGSVGIGNTDPASALDVTGKVTADDLTAKSNTPTVNLVSPNGSNGYRLFSNVSDTVDGGISIQDVSASNANRLLISHTGDISFYNSAGTSQDFYWDASAESLGIGTSSPNAKLHIDHSGFNAGSTASVSALKVQGSFGGGITISDTAEAGLYADGAGANLRMYVGKTALDTPFSKVVMTATSSGNVGIGTDSPSYRLDTNGGQARIARAHAGGIRSVNNANYWKIGTIKSANQGDRFHLKIIGANGYSNGTFPAGATEIYVTVENASDLEGIFYGVGAGSSNMVFDVAWTKSGSDFSIYAKAQAFASTGVLVDMVTAVASTYWEPANSDTGSASLPSGGASLESRVSWYTDGLPRMRLISNGDLLVGTGSVRPDSGTGNTGIQLDPSGNLRVGRAGDCMVLNRQSTDGAIVYFRKDGTDVGSIGNHTNKLEITGSGSNTVVIGHAQSTNTGAGLYFWHTNNAVLPYNSASHTIPDNVQDLGHSTYRWDDIYATNGTIQTSDANEKQDIEALSEAETRVAVAAKGLLRKFRWKSAVEEKGDDARIHFGIIAQDLQAAFEAEGLDAGRYGMFIHSTWWEHEVEVPAVVAQDAVYETQTDEEGNEMQVLVSEAVEGAEAYTQTDTYNTTEEAPEGAVERSRMGVRYSELLAFIIAAI